MRQYYAIGPRETAAMNTAELRENFLLENLFVAGDIQLVYTHYDRMMVGGVVPTAAPIALPNPANLKADFFLQRRELGILNIGAAGTVTVDGTAYELGRQDCLYVGRGAREVVFASLESATPAKFYLLSTPAHASCPTTRLTQAEATPVTMGALETANQRTIYKYIYSEGIQSCQLVMGLTQLHAGSVWNTMPAHTHDRRMEAYLYFDLPEGQRVLHLMGQPQETRHLWVGEGQAILSPPWSIHSGCGTAGYTFIWGMGGENQEYTDMDPAPIAELR
ncbi:5-dehydro-4-deoxy-D-glucuronate isomerase [Hymenobacter swuensis]|uniref:4-deoxy-L-threo-5-hexosulose-uronate ketol-isomerase n=1 Tax=Hymenobacter swuensis DY53 TaxID=1227739 RepID=W8EV85_9BACT|nr:5-dehydro-4-deoxy-D-glucuronate isomerase [Hymenobacter swuensis]AHJ97134.1 4-deoxy-L-threo-5-hexosulose-uronate ketol-isomerase [Hymenobacter swuensis DY53]